MKSDSQLIRKIQHHQDRGAANTLVERYYKEIYAYVYRQTGDRETALDLTQEIFIAILQGIHSFDEKKAGFRTWAYRVASNKIVNHYRSAAGQRQGWEKALIGEEPASFMDISELIIQRETIRQVMAVVAEFELPWIQLFQKKCFEGKIFTEIADELDLSVNTVKTRFYSMLKKIRQEVSWND